MRACSFAQSCLILCDPMDCRWPGSSIHGILQASRQEYWSVLPLPSPGNLPDPGIEPVSPTLQADSLPPEYQPQTVINECIWLCSNKTLFTKIRQVTFTLWAIVCPPQSVSYLVFLVGIRIWSSIHGYMIH